MTEPDATVAVSGTVSPEAEDTQIRFLTSKVDVGHPHLTMGPGAWIDRSTPPATWPLHAASRQLADYPQGRFMALQSFHAEARRLVDRLEVTTPATPLP